jgi:hypothetical protein
MNDLDKATYRRMRRAFGNGNEKRGRAIMQAIALRLEQARDKHPLYAEGQYHALGVIHAEFKELEHAVEHETESRQMDEALDVIATSVRFLGEEYK